MCDQDETKTERGGAALKLEWAFRIVMTVLLAVGAWFGSQVWSAQKEISNRLNVMDVDRATVAASRFTASDWMNGKTAIDAQFSGHDRRIFKLENTAEQMFKSLERIESRLGTK